MAPAAANPFALAGRVAVVTGGYGVLGGCLASGLAAAQAKVAVLGRRRDAALAKAEAIRRDGGEAVALGADVLDAQAVQAARDEVIRAWGRLYGLGIEHVGAQRHR